MFLITLYVSLKEQFHPLCCSCRLFSSDYGSPYQYNYPGWDRIYSIPEVLFLLIPPLFLPSGAGLKTFISPSPDWSVSRRFITFFRPLLIGPYLSVLSLFLFNLFKAFNVFNPFKKNSPLFCARRATYLYFLNYVCSCSLSLN